MRFLFTSAQLPGHLDWGGYLVTAAELLQRGHTVLWASGSEVQTLVERANVPFHSLETTGWRWPPPPLRLDPGMDPQIKEQLRAERALDQWLELERVIPACHELITLCREYAPDVVVGENFSSAAAIAAEVIDRPFVVAGWPALQIGITAKTRLIAEMGRQRLQKLLDRFSVTGQNWTAEGPPALLSPHLHLTYWSPSWYGGLNFLPQTVHVGSTPASVPSPTPPANLDDAHRKLLSRRSSTTTPWIFITLGTSFADDANFFVIASHAAAEVGALPIIALAGGAVPPRLAKSSVIFDQIDFAAILPHLQAAIHHGGAGTTHALVTHAVPQVVIPHAADQIHQAHGVARSGVGVGIQPHNVTRPGLTHLLSDMLGEDSHYRQRAKMLQQEFLALGGVVSGANLLEQVT